MSRHEGGLSDAAVTRLRALGRWPEFESGRYSVVEEIGRGGMGTVFLAVDEELGREVAIKIPNALANAGLERRLQSEARVLARLEHPGIVPIHDAGRLADGRLFYVMKRVKGRTLRGAAPWRARSDRATAALRTHLRAGRLRTRRRVHPSRPQARQHHGGLVRRSDGDGLGGGQDVDSRRPVGSRSQSTVGSQSRQFAVDSRWPVPIETGDGTVIGTVGFMAPEQARGDGGEIDARADVYGLGAILFLLLTDASLMATRRRSYEPRVFLDRWQPSARVRLLPSPRAAIRP